MLGQGAFESEVLEKTIVDIYALGDTSKCFPFSHSSQKISLVLIKPRIVA
jgi:hypothetical protein